MKFKQYLDKRDTVNILELMCFFDEYEEINESTLSDITKSFKEILPKVGLNVNQGKGLIQILMMSTKNVGLLLYYAFKVSTGDDSYKQKMKDILSSVKKEDLIDVLLRLDTLTLHTITGPIHIIDALTGWHIGSNILKASDDINDRAKRVIQDLKTLSNNTVGKTQKKLMIFVAQIKKMFKKSGQISSEVINI